MAALHGKTGSGGSRPQTCHRTLPAHQVRTVRPCSQPCQLRDRQRDAVCASWKTWGPAASHSEGDAEYYALTSRLSQQYGLFDPSAPQEAQPVNEPSQEESEAGPSSPNVLRPSRGRRPDFGLSPKQIQALGLTGPRLSNLPDPVSETPISLSMTPSMTHWAPIPIPLSLHSTSALCGRDRQQ